jgi:transcriptional regulator with XRE-family HTH domain
MSFDLTEELDLSKDYRDAFVDAHVSNGVAFQLRALRDSHDWDQKDVARELGKPSAQPMISRYENPDYGKYAVSSLLEIAHLYDVALIVKFAPFSELLRQDYESRSKSFDIPPYDEERKAGLINYPTYAVGQTGAEVAENGLQTLTVLTTEHGEGGSQEISTGAIGVRAVESGRIDPRMAAA